jgi:hypothetical protein
MTYWFVCISITGKTAKGMEIWTVTFERELDGLQKKLVTAEREEALAYCLGGVYKLPISADNDHGLFTPDGKPIDRETGEVQEGKVRNIRGG